MKKKLFQSSKESQRNNCASSAYLWSTRNNSAPLWSLTHGFSEQHYRSHKQANPSESMQWKLASAMGMTRKANPAVWHKTVQASVTDHWSEWTVRQVILHHLDISFQRNTSIFLAYHWKLLLKLSAVSPCCTFCCLPRKKDFSDSFSSTNFPRRAPIRKLLYKTQQLTVQKAATQSNCTY